MTSISMFSTKTTRTIGSMDNRMFVMFTSTERVAAQSSLLEQTRTLTFTSYLTIPLEVFSAQTGLRIGRYLMNTNLMLLTLH